MNSQPYPVVKPQVSFRMYLVEIALLFASLLTPIITWLIWHDGAVFARSGSVMVFLAAVAQFVSINRMNKKHLLNACRVKANKTPWDFSKAADIVGIFSLVAASAGTVVWGYGDLLLRT